MHQKPKFKPGDIVKKVFRTNMPDRQGIVVRIPSGGNQTVVLWENTKTAIYEFTKDLSLVEEAKEFKDKKDLYCVLVLGGVTVPVFKESYEEAEIEAKNIFFKTNLQTFIFKAISVIAPQDIKVQKLS